MIVRAARAADGRAGKSRGRAALTTQEVGKVGALREGEGEGARQASELARPLREGTLRQIAVFLWVKQMPNCVDRTSQPPPHAWKRWKGSQPRQRM